MKSGVQTLLIIVVFVCIIGGLSFIRNQVRSPPPAEPSANEEPDIGVSEARVEFPLTVVSGVPEYELHGAGKYEFWFQNPNSEAIELGLKSKSCKCSKIEIIGLTPEEAKTIRQRLPTAAIAQVLAGTSGFLSMISISAAANTDLCGFFNQPDRWQPLVPGDDKKVARVPGDGAGYVRFHWEGRAQGPIRLTAQVWAQLEGKPLTRGSETSLEIPIIIVRAIRVYPERTTVQDLGPNQARSAACYVWSSTRAGFSLSAQEDKEDPCVVCTAEYLTGEEFQEAAELLAKQESNTHPLSIYRVNVLLNERVPGKQMDLGPFVHEVQLKPDQEDLEKLAFSIGGTVRGDIQVGGSDDRDRIVLRTFSFEKGVTQHMAVDTAQPGTEVVLDSWSPKYLNVELVKQQKGDAASHWDLVVTVPPHRGAGALPKDSHIMLKTLDSPPRRIRIPIIGKGTLGLGSS
jgi:hypothetical protein